MSGTAGPLAWMSGTGSAGSRHRLFAVRHRSRSVRLSRR